MVPAEYFGLPGSSRSGENASRKSVPQRSPPASRIGLHSSSVVPGYVVLSSTTSWPFRRLAAIALVVSSTAVRSGSRDLSSGVGTQMMITSASRSRVKSAVASNRPASTTLRIISDGMCSM